MNKKNRSFLATFFILVVQLFPGLGRVLWRKWYDFLARSRNNQQLHFMNYGYDSDKHTDLSGKDEKYRYQIQLYLHVIEAIDLNNKRLLEVGSGRGGGINYLSSNNNLASASAVDLSGSAIEKCKLEYPESGIHFLQGSADNLPLESNSVDVVINVESSHCYPDFEAFCMEVSRVLSKDGIFSMCDIRQSSDIVKMESIFKSCGFVVVKKVVINEQVISALEKMTDDRLKIANEMPAFLTHAFKDFAGTKSSAVYEMLKNNKLTYISYQLRL